MARIGFLLTTTPWYDRRQFHREAPALVDAGHDVVYFSGQIDRELDTSFEERPIPDVPRRKARRYGALNLYKLVRSEDLDVLQLCSLEQLPLGVLLKITTSIKVVYDCREDMAPAMLRHRDNFPLVVRWGMYAITRVLEKAASVMFDGIITADPAVYEKHSSMPESRKMIFYNAAPLRHFDGRYEPLPERRYDIVVMGSMTPRSGVIDLVKAVARLAKEGRRVRTMLLGQPDEFISEEIESVIQDAGIEDIVDITGYVDHKLVPAKLAQARIGAVPLRDFEKFRSNIACKAFEYMACGMPTICSDLPPQHIFIEEMENGLFYPPSDIDALADAIRTLLDDQDLLIRMGSNARRDVEQQWHAEKFEDELRAFYATLLSAKRRFSLI